VLWKGGYAQSEFKFAVRSSYRWTLFDGTEENCRESFRHGDLGGRKIVISVMFAFVGVVLVLVGALSFGIGVLLLLASMPFGH
jgi:hypothetical protein